MQFLTWFVKYIQFFITSMLNVSDGIVIAILHWLPQKIQKVWNKNGNQFPDTTDHICCFCGNKVYFQKPQKTKQR